MGITLDGTTIVFAVCSSLVVTLIVNIIIYVCAMSARVSRMEDEATKTT